MAEVFVPATGRVCVVGDTGDTCSASAGTNLPEGWKRSKNGPDYVTDLVPHMLLAV